MTILLVYATNSGGTLVASGLVRDVLQQQGHAVTLKRANTVEPNELKKFDLIILGSCSWDWFKNGKRIQGQLQEHMQDLREKLRQRKTILPGHKFAVFGLGDSSYTYFCAAVDKLVELVSDLGGELVSKPLRIDGFFFYPDRNEKLVREWAERVAQRPPA